MTKAEEIADWRTARRRPARDGILDAAWSLVREEGLAALSLRDPARRAGITAPTVYAYFESKNAIYDAMFGQAATQFAERMAERYDDDEPHGVLIAGVERFFEFCTSDPARYQLLFQRRLPGFEPSTQSFAPAVRALADARELLARNGVSDPRHVDMWTALVTGLVDQQVSNDPGGERWTRLGREALEMLLEHCRSRADSRLSRTPRPIKEARP